MGGDKQTSTMVLKVDLQCQKCYKKIKKVLCQFPQIQDQVYDEKANTVAIKVVCCSPDCIKKKIIRKGGDSIKSIDIKLPEKPPPPPKPEPPTKPTPPEKPKPKELEKPKDAPPKPKEQEKPKDPPPPKPKEPEKPKDPPPTQEKPKPNPPPAAVGHPLVSSCPECYEGRPGGPCFHVFVPAGPPPCYQYDGYYGRPVYDSYGGGRSYYVNRCDYFSEENTGACAIM